MSSFRMTDIGIASLLILASIEGDPWLGTMGLREKLARITRRELNRNTLREMLVQLCERGLLKRKRDPKGGPTYLYALTREGTAVLNRTRRQVERCAKPAKGQRRASSGRH